MTDRPLTDAEQAEVSAAPQTLPAEFQVLDGHLERAKTAQLSGDDRGATYWHWQIVKLGRRTRNLRLKAACLATAAYYHGFVAYRDHQYPKAERLYRKAIELGLDNDWAYMNAGCALREQGRLADALPFFQQAVALDGEVVQSLTALGNTAYELGDERMAAWAWARALSRTPTDPAQLYDQAILSLMLGDYATGWRLHAARWQAPLFAAAHRPPPSPDWDGNATDARLMLFAEQGNGDAIMLLRWLPWVRSRAPNAVLCIHKPLLRLCEQNWQDLEVFPLEAMPAHDLKCSLFDLPMLAGCASSTDLPDGTILRAPAGALPHLEADGRKNIGLVWAGGTQTHHDWRRSVPWRFVAPLLDVPGCRFVVLQLERLEGATDDPRLIFAKDLGGGLPDFASTALWMESLDLVISVDTSTAHLAGALGVPCWMPLPRLPDYRWGLKGSRTPWYPWTRLFRQDVAQDWEPVVARIKTALEAFVGGDETQAGDW